LKLPELIQNGLEHGRITEGHAKALLALETPGQQLALYDKILEQGLNVREIEKAAKPAMPGRAVVHAPKASDEDPNLRALEDALSTFMGSPVKLQKSET